MQTRTTYTAQQMADSRAAWDAGDFSDEWKPWRHEAAMVARIIFPPAGTKWDQWDVDEPSQRAVLIRAIRETPNLLHQAIKAAARGPASWSTVIGFLLAANVEFRRDRDEEIERAAYQRDRDPDPAEARQSIAAILRGIAAIDGQPEERNMSPRYPRLLTDRLTRV